MHFTPFQQQAIDARNRELLVSAAAGSGKTAVLVERILSMIQRDHLSIENMLIVTFTRAAAAEMRERLEVRLSDAADGDERLLRQADLVAGAHISTIHAFCQHTVRQHFQHCQIDPQFGLCDERTRAAFYEESMEEVLDAVFESAAADEELSALVGKYTEQEIVSMLDSLYRFLMSRPDPMEWLQRHAAKEWNADTLNAEPMAVAFCREAALIIEGMLSLWHELEEAAHAPSFPEKYLVTLRADAVELRALSSACDAGLTQLIGALNALTFTRLPVVRPETADEAALCALFKETRARYKDMVDELKKLLPEDMDMAMGDLAATGPAARGLAKAMLLFHETFQSKKREQAVIDFNDLEHMTLSVLRDPALQKQLSQRFDAIFVDEYQDVSELQEAILNGLKRPASDPRPQYAFYVGDVKQSIYRFRLAEPGLFLSKLASFSSDENAPQRKIILNRNFRSKSAVLDAVNRIFEHVMDSRVTEIDYDDDAKLYPGVPSKGDPVTEVHVLSSREETQQDMVLAEAEFIARDIERTVGKPLVDGNGEVCGFLHFRDIAVLLPVSKNIAPKVELVFQQHGIPVYSDSASSPMESDEIQQLVQYMTLLDNLMNDVALLSVLRSPIFDFTEPELSSIRLVKPEREASFLTAMMEAAQTAENPALRSRCAEALRILEEERLCLSSMPLGDYLWDFLGRSGLYAHYGAQSGGRLRQANLRMLCTRAHEYEKTHSDGLHGFVESICAEGADGELSPTVMNPWEDVVRIMTIHKSKGLEFPTVYVMNLGRGMFGRGSTRTLSVHGEVGFGLSYVNEEARTTRMTLLQGAIALREKNAERAERARVLYVALTRPKARLVMVGSQSFEEETYDAFRSSLRTPADVYAVRNAHSMLDWVLQSVREEDQIELHGGEAFSTETTRKTPEPITFSSESTSFPQKSAHWRVVFHINPVIPRPKPSKKNIQSMPIALAAEASESFSHLFARRTAGADPIAPELHFSRLPLKVGVTALCRAMEEGASPSDEEENAETKRYPIAAAQPRLLSTLPALPAFLEPPKEEHALMTGVETHRVLGLMNLDLIRPVMDHPKAVYARICSEIERMVDSGVMTRQQSDYVNRSMIARFFESDLGKRALKSPRVMREWAFNLRVREPFSTLVQGVIDLCFLEDGGWVLVDFKTDRCETAAELYPRYRRQLAFYRRALEAGTPYPVRETLLYALRLGESFAETDANS